MEKKQKQNKMKSLTKWFNWISSKLRFRQSLEKELIRKRYENKNDFYN